MPSFLRMPAPAAGVEEATLLEWSIEEKAEFAPSDVLLVIETDKAVIDVEAETAGVLHRKLVTAGRSVAVGTPLAVIGAASDSVAEIDALAAQAVSVAPEVATAAEPEVAPIPEPVATSATSGAHDGPSGPQGVAQQTGAGPGVQGRIFASPIARQMAKAAGLTLAELTGTGPGGRIVRWDVEHAAAKHRVAEEKPAASGQAHEGDSAMPADVRGTTGSDSHAGRRGERTFTDEPHSKIRHAIASRLTESKQTVPHFYVRATPKVDKLLAMRAELNAGGGQKVSVNDLVVRAVAKAHRRLPAANVIFMDDAMRRFDFVDVAVAIATEGGLVTPVLRDADRMPVTEIASTTADFAARARSGRLRQHELEGGSITVTNLGMFAVEEFDAIINPPHAAILAVGAARPEPVVVDGPDGRELAVATVMHLSLSVDHRALDGVVAGQWMAELTNLLEHPLQILA